MIDLTYGCTRYSMLMVMFMFMLMCMFCIKALSISMFHVVLLSIPL
jgi:hypothetical protein